MKGSEKQMIESNEVAKNDFNMGGSGVPHEKQNEIFNRLVEENALELYYIKDKTDPNNLINEFRTDGNEPKDFGYYQGPLKLLEDLRDENINPKEVLKNQARLKSDLNKIKIRDKKLPNQKNTINNITNFFDLREKRTDFFRDYSFLLSEAK